MGKLNIISEIGINHNGDFRRIEELIRQSKAGGADYAKFQVYNSKTVFGDDSRAHNEFSQKELSIVAEMCDVYGIEFMTSVFDIERFRWCEQLNMKTYKIASRTVARYGLNKADTHLIDEIIATGKPLIASLGMMTHPDMVLPFQDEDNVTLLNCISKYPTMYSDYKNFKYDNKVTGYSDHACGIGYALYNISKGARIIEKHFTLNKGMDGNDHIGSMNLEELKILREYGDQLKMVDTIVKANTYLSDEI
jgi:sialic acid synthase SpsE